MYLLCTIAELKSFHHGWGLCQIFFDEFRLTTLSKKWTSQLVLVLFTNLALENLGLVFGWSYLFFDMNIHCQLQQPGYYDFGTVTFSNYIKHTYWEIFTWDLSNWNWVNVHWIYPGSISDSNDMISLIEEEHEIMTDKEFFKKFMSEK